MRPPALPSHVADVGVSPLRKQMSGCYRLLNRPFILYFYGNDMMVSYSACSGLGLRDGVDACGPWAPYALLTLGPGQYKED